MKNYVGASLNIKSKGWFAVPMLKERAAASERWAELCYALAGVFELLASLAELLHNAKCQKSKNF